MAEVKVTLSDEMVKFLEGICETQQKLAVAAEHINAVSEALSKLGLKQDDAYEILAMFIAAKENIGRDQARRTLRCLMNLVTQVQGEETTAVATVERE